MNKTFLIIIALLTLGLSTPSFAQKAPSFKLLNQHGIQKSLDDYKGKVVLLDFWASWCIPCRLSFPWMNDMQNTYKNQGFEIVAINVDKEKSEFERFIKQYPAAFTVLLDPKGDTPRNYKVMGMPTSFLISRKGELVSRHIGFKRSKKAEYEAQILNEIKQ